MRSARLLPRRDDRGTVTAEFAVVMPAVLLVLAFGLGVVRLGVEQLRLQGAAFDAARLVGRGGPGASQVITQVHPDADFAIHRADGLVCVTASAPGRLGVLTALRLEASSCVLDDEQP